MLYIVLPVYNEQEGLPLLLKDIACACTDLPYRVVIVNDGSTDQTPQLLAELNNNDSKLEVITHPQNRGLSEALMSGFHWVISQREEVVKRGEKDLVVTLDADNTHPADRIILLYERIQTGADLVIASRYVDGGGQIGLGLLRRFLSRMASWLMHLFFPIKGVRDYSCGYRAYRLDILQQGFRIYGKSLIESHSFAGMVELLLKLAPLCQGVSEIPLQLHYERKSGLSKMKILATIWGYLILIFSLKRRTRSTLEWLEE